MKVYVAFTIYQYEGGHLLGVFKTKSLAEKCCKVHNEYGDKTLICDVKLDHIPKDYFKETWSI